MQPLAVSEISVDDGVVLAPYERALYVRVDAIGQGIGTLLLDWAKAQSGGRLWLYTFERNARARRFYESSGFTITDRGFEEDWQLADIKYEWSEDPSP